MLKIIHMFYIKGNTLQTISNCIFLATLVIAFICLINALFSMKKNNNSALANILFSTVMFAFAYTYNSNEKIFSLKISNIFHLIALVLVIINTVLTLIAQVAKKPKNGRMIIKTENEDGEIETVEISGKQYEREFNKRKRHNLILNAIRDIFMIICCLLTTTISSLCFDKMFVFLVNYRLNGAMIASLSVYSMILGTAVIVSAILGWIIGKFDNLY